MPARTVGDPDGVICKHIEAVVIIERELSGIGRQENNARIAEVIYRDI